MWYFYKKDKVEKEPAYLLITLYVGGIIACLTSITISIFFKENIHFLNSNYEELNILQTIFKTLIIIATFEELFKWIINYIISWKSKNFNHLFDQIVYSTFLALGFATIENILYGLSLSRYGLTPILLRGIISVPSHAVFGVYMGYYLSLSKNASNSKKASKSTKYKLLSIIVPIFLHFIYNLLLVNPTNTTYLLFIIYIITLYVSAYIKIKRLSTSHAILKN